MNENERDIFADIARERAFQSSQSADQTFGPFGWVTLIAEKLGGAAHAASRLMWHAPTQEQAEDAGVQYRSELVQLAAMTQAAIVAFDEDVETGGWGKG